MEDVYHIYENIFNILSESVWGMTIEEIAKHIKMHRNTVSKYMYKLEKLGLVVKKKIGKYTLWLPKTIYDYHKTDIVRRFVEGVISSIYESGGVEKVRKAGVDIAKYIMESLSNSEEAGVVYGSTSDLQELIGVSVPTLIPKLRVKVTKSNFSDKVVFVDLLGCPENIDDFQIVCEFFLGYIKGTLTSIGVPYKNIELIEHIRENGECKYSVLLEKTVEEIAEYLLSQNAKRRKII